LWEHSLPWGGSTDYPFDEEVLDPSIQKNLHTLVWESQLEDLLRTSDSEEEKAALLASRGLLSSKWLQCFPISDFGTVIDDNTFRINICLRFSIPISDEHMCTRCRKRVTGMGAHALSCRYSAGRFARHSLINSEIYKALNTAHVPSRREPVGIFEDGLRPDGVTLQAWQRGLLATWDATVVDRLALCYISSTSTVAGAAANRAEASKKLKYQNTPPGYEFFPIAFETLGSAGESTTLFIEDLCNRLRETTGDSRVGSFFLQRLSLAIIRGNAIAIMGAFTSEDGFLVDVVMP
jgi:hypothetical protein